MPKGLLALAPCSAAVWRGEGGEGGEAADGRGEWDAARCVESRPEPEGEALEGSPTAEGSGLLVTSGGDEPGERRPLDLASRFDLPIEIPSRFDLPIEILIPRDASEPREAARGSEVGGDAPAAREALEEEPSGSEALGKALSASGSSARGASC